MTKSPTEQFQIDCALEVEAQGNNANLKSLSRGWFNEAMRSKYSYHFEWMGRPIIQFPQDIVAMQEIIWRVKPDLLIETGVAHGGSLIFYASMMDLIGHGQALGIDIDIRPHNRDAIEAHPMFRRITLLQGSSTEPSIVATAKATAAGKRVLVVLDSNHTHDHVLAELHAYAPLVTIGSYCVVMDTVIEDMAPNTIHDRPWSAGNNPKTAVAEFLKSNSNFKIDTGIDDKLLISVAPSGYLKRTS
jgi:cephalosporin hydroxylase